ncbi:thiamine-phosphate kinase [Campylobacter fetus]|uniref:thiamine-phosphate kinase n=1 Tax=Campylobacter fetus TaxID=196 RepID=UPI000509099C|nr:thiamine-phosphate kinase [Campylobacter fetus]WKW17464.1 thiamine-phosphate kinase [Campylobacter fetus subsp. fetus]AIR78050.1 thiamine monophosphate kinase [Campylobacter fetus subsp. fetus 04/554]EAJ5693920.1 thiamine-phosphate kinase [Campylobacter fetus]EAJ5703613.1 thiamine-phosphate kinase [Campylobacter fetus]EAJ9257062.1 thiamine-phosphate kinase [Campylobacter fetus]
MDKEQSIIDRFSHKLNGDDGAVVGKMVLSKDMFVENSHFKRKWLSAYEIGTKAILVNLSDAVAMNATPKYALLGLGIPKNISNNYIYEICRGIKSAAKDFNVEIVGGDTIKSSEIIISLTIISYLNSKKPIFRNTSRLGDLVCYTGKLGDSLKGLRILQNGGNLPKNSRFKRPVLRVNFMKKAAPFIHSAMDISDGLASDLPKICSKFGIKFKNILSKDEFRSGEEYELLFTVSKKHLKRMQNEAKKCRLKLNILGKLIKGKYKSYGKYSHF